MEGQSPHPLSQRNAKQRVGHRVFQRETTRSFDCASSCEIASLRMTVAYGRSKSSPSFAKERETKSGAPSFSAGNHKVLRLRELIRARFAQDDSSLQKVKVPTLFRTERERTAGYQVFQRETTRSFDCASSCELASLRMTVAYGRSKSPPSFAQNAKEQQGTKFFSGKPQGPSTARAPASSLRSG